MVDFLIIGPYLSVGNANMFSLIKNRNICLGYNKVSYFDNNNKSVVCRWFSNMKEDYPPMLLLKEYKEDEYSKYDHFAAINIDKLEDIPDYDGIIGVPVSFLDVWNPEQFELIGFPGIGIVPEGWKGMTEDFIKLYYEQGNTGCYEVGKKMGYFVKDGKAIIPYVRLLIKKKIS